MNTKPINQTRDEDARNALAALQRAALQARRIAAQTRTALVVVKDGKLVREMVDWDFDEPLHR
ncbi:hypothetical protein NP590_00520 [Methylomonas sp. SURF-2]|uniref:Uncharacterized protein n=1 Tax=Methylomonas subterranea TaxID=2952225 RepID=A0ABT1TAS8_9GAMM|nr:hypothetical protein [Methylomonas sp. SURF-2]MCQ8102569.1 hypothetical protein [Methylomonas sp. SURF-2]